MFKPPGTIDILGALFSLSVTDEEKRVDGSGVFGYLDRPSQSIYVYSKQTDQYIGDTTIHECIHAINDSLGLGMRERDVVRWTTSIRSLIMHNPDLLVWLAEMLSGNRYKRAR